MNIWFSTTNNVGYIWNAEDAAVLRRKHRIIGTWSGCLSQAFQTLSRGLPLLLMPEEIDCIISCQSLVVRLLDADRIGYIATNKEKTISNQEDEIVNIFNKLRTESYRDQIGIYKQLRQEKVAQMVDKIVGGKKRKQQISISSDNVKKTKKSIQEQYDCVSTGDEAVNLSNSEDSNEILNKEENDNIDNSDLTDKVRRDSDSKSKLYDSPEVEEIFYQNILSEEIEKIKDIHSDLALVQTFYEHPWFRKLNIFEYSTEKWKSRLKSPQEGLKSATFSSLWTAGFYVTDGDKFGADFLAYQGDPVLFHAAYIVICQVRKSLDEEKLSEKLLVARCRLGTAVKKTILLASFDRTKSGTNENQIKFKRLIWTASNDAEDIHTR